MLHGSFVTFLCDAGFAIHNVVAAWKTGVRVQNVTTNQLSEKIEQADCNIVLVDVRDDAERSVSTLPGAISKSDYLAKDDFPENTVVVAYCTIGGRSYQFARQQCELGKTVLNYRASILGWCRHHLPVVTTDGQETKFVHTYWPIFWLPKEYIVVVQGKNAVVTSNQPEID